ncbi:MAG: hypothetical protein L6R38_000258 [Xanthoria sp. 2 TBL-2021]|nr:MAG: hypothetical protein L6R38_000258 [Xanthoria sp. 2 TBL-2021]
MVPSKFIADVQWWDEKDVYVLCPFCENVHHHSFRQSYTSNDRSSHCFDRLRPSRYCLRYPFSQEPESSAYEIDKENKRYVALGASPPSPEKNLLTETLAALKIDRKPTVMLPKWEATKETITTDDHDTLYRRLRQAFGADPTYQMKRIDYVTSRMILFGNIDILREYLESSQESETLIHGIDSNEKTALLYMACEKYPAIVHLLLARGADPNFQTQGGRTPLMEAALWGRCEIVQHLLEHGADPSIKDIHGLRAIDLAAPSDRNETERYDRSGREHQVYQEITYTANQARKMIVLLLKDDTSDRLQTIVDGHVQGQFFQKTTRSVKLFAPVAEYHIPTPHKTIAHLERGGRYPSIAAMSGWSHGKTVPLVSGMDWTPEVIRIANIVGHALAHDKKDNGIPGRFYACHAEKQLIAYFISRHVFLETEIRTPKKAFEYLNSYYCTQSELEEATRRGEYEEGGTLHDLAATKPPVSLKQASILVSSPPCSDCVCFTRTINAKLHLRITVHDALLPG